MKPSALALIFLLLGSGQPSPLLAKNKTTPTKTTKSKAPAPAKKASKPVKATLPVAPYSLSGKAAEGVAAYIKDDYSKSASLLAEHRKSYPNDPLAHTLGYLEARALILAKKKPEAKTRLEALSANEGPLQSEVFYLLGDLYEDFGEKKKAQETLAKVERGSRRYDAARLMLAGLSSSLTECDEILSERFYWTKDRAKALSIQQKFAEKAGDTARVKAIKYTLFREYPMTDEGDAIVEEILAGEPRTEDIFARLGFLLEKKKSSEAAGFVRALEKRYGDQDPLVLEAKGDLAFAARDWKDAISFFEKAQAKSKDDWRAMRRQANALARKDETFEQALTLYQKVYESDSKEAKRAMLDAARLLRDKDRLDEARELAKKASDTDDRVLRKEALWVSGWLAWRVKDPIDAAERFDALVAFSETLNASEKEVEELDRRKMGFHMRERALYWSARAYSAQGKTEEATTRYKKIVQEYPLSYYSHQSFNRLQESGAATLEELRVRQKDKKSLALQTNEEDKSIEAPTKGFQISDDPSVRAALAMYGLGLTNDAIDELKSQANQGTLSTDGGAFLGALALNEDGVSQGTWMMLWKWDFARYPGEHTMKSATSEERLVDLGWKIAFPRAYGDIVDEYSKKFDVPSEMVFAIMRAESTFRPEVVSPANAVGLTQVLPSTANWIATQLLNTTKPSRSQLFEESTNVQLGSRFMKELVTLFKGNYALAIASYNAGPGAGMRWYKRWKDLSTDEIIEEIPYQETHGYTKKVLGSMGAYRYVWGDWSKEETRSITLDNKLPATLGTYNGKQM